MIVIHIIYIKNVIVAVNILNLELKKWSSHGIAEDWSQKGKRLETNKSCAQRGSQGKMSKSLFL